MPTLLEKIETNAANRLSLPPGRKPSEELARYKNFLKIETHRLKILHRAGGGGRDVCQARSAILDVTLRYILIAVQNNLPDADSKKNSALSLVALGGYGRTELNPHSDIDIMFLHDGSLVSRGEVDPALQALIDGILYTLWDIGFKVGHSVRSIADCVKVANSDMRSKTSLIEARLIAGSDALFQKFQKTVLSKCVAGHEAEYINARLLDQSARRAKFGNSALMQEPNLKNGCGGLRDYQNLIWMTFFKYRTRSLHELQEKEMISESERKQLESAYDFLLRVRNEIHYHLDRPVDVLGKSIQPSIALNLGYRERSASKRIEEFMGDFTSFTATRREPNGWPTPSNRSRSPTKNAGSKSSKRFTRNRTTSRRSLMRLKFERRNPMPELVYFLCAIASFICAALLLRKYRRTRVQLLFWSSLCFICLTLNNFLLFLDMAVLPQTVDLSLIRNLTNIAAISLLLYGMIWDTP